MTFLKCGRWIVAGLTVFLMLATNAADAATPVTWKDTGFSINADGLTFHDMLNEFGATYGVRVEISIKDDRPMKGHLKADSGADFLDRLTQEYKFRWFVYNDTLYIVPRNDNLSERMEIGEDAVQDAKAALVGMGLYDARFGWGELPDEGVVLVSGPREYVKLVHEVLLPTSDPKDPKRLLVNGKQVMIFRLKYANATDRTITVRGEKETIPGLKTILGGILNAGDGRGAAFGKLNPSQFDSFDIGSSKHSREGKNGIGGAIEIGKKDSGDAGGGIGGVIGAMGGVGGAPRDPRDTPMSNDSDRSQKKNGSSTHEDPPHIDADPSLNAIIIFDLASRHEMYKELIDQLDVEPQQVEIEALIIDIDRSKIREMGSSWGVVGSQGLLSNGISSGGSASALNSTMLIGNMGLFYAQLRLMENSGDARVLAKPTVLTLDNVEAVLDLNQTAYLPLIGERVADMASVTAGTSLRVVPRIVKDGGTTRVRLDVDIEDGNLGDPSLKSGVTRSTISTQALIDHQQTLMIGGYHSESSGKGVQKVPGLGDIPLLGALFRNTTENEFGRERLFLITPRIIGTVGTTGIVASRLSKAARIGRKLIAEAEREEEKKEQEEAAAAVTTPAAVTAPAPEAVRAPTLPAPAAPPVSVPVPGAPSSIPLPMPAIPTPVPNAMARPAPAHLEASGPVAVAFLKTSYVLGSSKETSADTLPGRKLKCAKPISEIR